MQACNMQKQSHPAKLLLDTSPALVPCDRRGDFWCLHATTSDEIRRKSSRDVARLGDVNHTVGTVLLFSCGLRRGKFVGTSTGMSGLLASAEGLGV